MQISASPKLPFVVASALVFSSCGPKPSTQAPPVSPECRPVDFPPNSEALKCAIRRGDPQRPIRLVAGVTYAVDYKIDRSIELIGPESDDALPVLKGNAWESPDLTVRRVQFEPDSVVVNGTFELDESELQTESLSVSGPAARVRKSRLFSSNIEFEVNDIESSDSTIRSDVLAVRTATGQIVDTRFEAATVRVEQVLTGPLYVTHNNFTTAPSFVGSSIFVERNCFVSFPQFGPGIKYAENRSGSCQQWTPVWIATGSTFSVPGFDTTTMKVGDFDGKPGDEIIRVSETGWHRLDLNTGRWSYLGVDPAPAWTLGVGDFDGDGKDDMFKADGFGFWFSPAAIPSQWEKLSDHTSGFARQNLMLADVDGDGTTDVVRPGVQLEVSAGGRDAFLSHPGPAGRPTFRWLADVDDTPGYDWVTEDKSGNRTLYNFVSRKISSFSLGVGEPRQVGQSEHLLRTSDGLTRCLSSQTFLGCAYEDRAGGFGGGGSGGSHEVVALVDTAGTGHPEPIHQLNAEDDCQWGGRARRVATYNVNHAGVRTADEIGDTIRRLNASVVAVQEVDRNTKRNRYDMAAAIQKASGFEYSRFVKSNDYQGGDYGQLILSTEPIHAVTVVRLPDHANKKEWSEHYVATYFETAGLRVVATHIINSRWRTGLDLSETHNNQVDALIRIVQERTPDLVLGDFNLTPDSEQYDRFVSKTCYDDAWKRSNDGVGNTFPDLHGEPRRIDYVFTRAPDAVCGRVPTEITSDHYPLVVGIPSGGMSSATGDDACDRVVE